MLLSACGADPCDDPLYDGGTQDEAFRAVVDAEKHLEVGSPRAPTVTSPTADQAFTAPAAFTWTSPLRVEGFRTRPSPPRRGWFDRALSLVISEAQAHGEPYTGDLYDVTVRSEGGKCLARVITGNLAFTPPDELWARFAAEGAPLELSIASAYLRDDRVTEGPFAPAAPVRFTVER